MYLAHAGHDHMNELNGGVSVEFLIGAALLVFAILIGATVVYDSLKNRKEASKKKR